MVGVEEGRGWRWARAVQFADDLHGEGAEVYVRQVWAFGLHWGQNYIRWFMVVSVLYCTEGRLVDVGVI